MEHKNKAGNPSLKYRKSFFIQPLSLNMYSSWSLIQSMKAQTWRGQTRYLNAGSKSKLFQPTVLAQLILLRLSVKYILIYYMYSFKFKYLGIVLNFMNILVKK